MPRQKHLDIDGAYFGISFANILFKTYPDLYPKDGPLTYQPLIFGFKIFGQKGSAYEEKWCKCSVLGLSYVHGYTLQHVNAFKRSQSMVLACTLVHLMQLIRCCPGLHTNDLL